ncbi:hypothetical protein BO86DRAFT_50918 [Aspergillus japonicus CBS 114.51]|uniref:RNase MRP protein 1 RNA binding domain-containing protein n=2 Tax=Aspergillus TaxID=5052 RepID=A0A2V5HL92_ASPV1|nr:hypothetical protein BO86DRAFT_50918 [Aspergillus japonicus CBS 114.51]PYI23312.1 hypothetical protein BO99DRAFT_200784 [Aspergillus violaceofuscus CBS 115571]RAH83431.1 hypothetical protein BO86DRAFT_50918 [Aspergillus japonicus CBS 114.51]
MDLEKLFAIHSILHLIYHRNKNQHGNTKWWKWLAILKRTTRKLVMSIGHRPSYIAGQSSAPKYTKPLAHTIIPRCYLVFSTVVADGQFSTLGTVLLATLARLAKAIGFRKELKIPATTVVTSALDSSSEITKEEDVGTVVSRGRPNPVIPLPPDHCDLDDLGRMAYQKSTGSLPRGSGRCEETKMEERIQKKKKKNRRKDAIDDLFDSLL